MTLRLDKPIWARLRQEAFDREASISDVVRETVDEHLARTLSRGCDRCGKPATHVTTPGGTRGCDDHFAADAGSTP